MSVTQVALTLATAYLCLLGPGMAWWRPRAAVLPRLLAWVCLSALWTTLAGLILAALESFSVPLLVLVNAVVSLAGYAAVGRLRRSGHFYAEPASVGPAVAAIALLLLWPPFETHLGAQDATTYTAAGIHLARSGKLSKTDQLVDEIPPRLRTQLFRSVYGAGPRPPFARMPGGMVTESPDSNLVIPSFVPAPYPWAALFAQTFGESRAGGYAPLFMALSLWACWQLCRRRMGAMASLAVTGLVALNSASYWAGRFALSEPMAVFFLWAGLAALDGFEEEGFTADAMLAGLMLAAASIVRIELLIFIPVALAIRELLSGSPPLRRLGPAFYLPLALIMAVAFLTTTWASAGHAASASYIVGGAAFKILSLAAKAPAATLVTALSAAALVWLAARRVGIRRGLLVGLPAAAVLYYTVFASEPQLGRSLGWLQAILGWPALAMAAAGFVVAWRDRFYRPGNVGLLALTATVSLFILYDPHVMTETIWASRRLVVVVVPASILLAALAAGRLARRSALAGLLAWALLLTSVLVGRPALSGQSRAGGGRPTVAWQSSPAPFLWGRPFYRGNHAQLREVADMLPAGSVALIDDRLASYILGTALWLIHDRPSVPVVLSSKRGRNAAAWLVRSLGAEHELFLLRPTLTAAAEPLPFVKSELVGSLTLPTLQPRRRGGWPRHGEHYTKPLSLYRLEKVTLRRPPPRK